MDRHADRALEVLAATPRRRTTARTATVARSGDAGRASAPSPGIRSRTWLIPCRCRRRSLRHPRRVWALVADLTQMGEWSPENEGVEWLGGATGPGGRRDVQGVEPPRLEAPGRPTGAITEATAEPDARVPRSTSGPLQGRRVALRARADRIGVPVTESMDRPARRGREAARQARHGRRRPRRRTTARRWRRRSRD